MARLMISFQIRHISYASIIKIDIWSDDVSGLKTSSFGLALKSSSELYAKRRNKAQRIE